MTTDQSTSKQAGLSVAALWFGVFVLVALFVVLAPFGVGTVELAIWLLLLVGWVSFWMVKRRR